MSSNISTLTFWPMDFSVAQQYDFNSATVEVVVRAVVPTVLLLLSLIIWSLYHNNNIDPSLKLPLPPGSMGLPIIGETFMYLLRRNNFYDSRRLSYGQVYKTHIFGSPVIRVIGANNIKKILMNENNLVTAYWPASVRMLLGDGTVANAIGDLHRTRRRALQKAFNHDAMSDYVPVMQKVVRSFIQNWCSQDSVSGYPECKRMSFALASEALVGFRMKPDEYRSVVEVFDVFVNNLFCLPVHFPGLGFAKGMGARRTLLQKIEECLIRRKQEIGLEEHASVHGFQDAMSRLLDVDGEDSLSTSEIKDLCLELLFAGHATTASAATSLLIQLNKNSDVVSRIQAELEENGLSRGEQGDLNLTALGSMEYVAAVVKEVLRMSPPVGGAFRTVLKSFTLNGYQIPAGWTLAYSIRETQETTNHFLDADKFNPDRWLHCNRQDDKFHYLPFGGGSRSCVGKEFAKIFLRVFVIEIARSCTWRLANCSAEMNYLPVPHPVDGLPVSFTAITGSNRPRSNTL